MKESEVDRLAKIIWDYMLVGHQLEPADAVFCLCSHDTQVGERAADLFLEGYGDWLIFSGGVGRLTEGIFDKSEAEIFADVAMAKGVKPDKILLETKSKSTGDNVTLTYALLQEKGLRLSSFVLVQKPYMERRTYATFMKQWPEKDVRISVTSPQISYSDYMKTPQLDKTVVINTMVGDLQRIKEYPALGFQIEQEIPAEVWDAFEQLVAAGYDKQLIK